MNRILLKASLLITVMSIPMYGWAFGPCMPIAKACMQQGYTEKKAMMKECMLPVVRGQKSLPNTNFTPSQMQQCKLAIIEKMKAKANNM